ncbi:MAG: SBBP repeat-containing protein [Bacteroidetes bacterium]|nr:SBBP repeat-containing protein [Bacteroidota bacterium]
MFFSGYTESTNNISTLNSHQPINNGANDAFLVKFDSTGQRIWGTFYGDVNDDYGKSCFSDSLGNIYLAGSTNSWY